MPRCSILFGNDPQAYRQTLAAVVSAVRQNVDPIIVEPEDLDEEVRHRHVCLVICSRLTEGIKATVADWILLYPDGDQCIEMNRGGERTFCNEFELDDLLAAIDGAVARLCTAVPDTELKSAAMASHQAQLLG